MLKLGPRCPLCSALLLRWWGWRCACGSCGTPLRASLPVILLKVSLLCGPLLITFRTALTALVGPRLRDLWQMRIGLAIATAVIGIAGVVILGPLYVRPDTDRESRWRKRRLLTAASLGVVSLGLSIVLVLTEVFVTGGTMPWTATGEGLGLPGDQMRLRFLRRLGESGEETMGAVEGLVVDTTLRKRAYSVLVDSHGNHATYWSDGGFEFPVRRSQDRRRRGTQLIGSAEKSLGLFRRYTQSRVDFPRPPVGRVRFYAITKDDIRLAEVAHDSLTSGRHRLSDLYRLTKNIERLPPRIEIGNSGPHAAQPGR